jgi:hypothetical protein
VSAIDAFCRTLLVGVFVAAVVGKGTNRRRFAAFADSLLPLLPGGTRAATTIAAGVIVAELLAVATLCAQPTIGYAAAVLVLAGLTGGIATALRRGVQVRCQCFGAAGSTLTAAHLIRNLVLLLVSGAGLAAHLGAPPAPAAVAATAAVGGLVAGACITRWDDLTTVVTG